MKKIFTLFALVSISKFLFAVTWQVGPTRTYTMPSQVSTLVANNDTVEIDAAIYNSDVCRWTANNLVLKGVGGLAHLKANGNSYGGKAIWVIQGTNTTVEWIEFSLCACPSNNGAGIRQEGIDLTVRNCYFHDNENGILAGDNTTSNMLIEYTEFYNNGFGDGFTHNLYINHLNSLTFRYNYSHHAIVGHELKSRAHNNYILYNRFSNEATGDASREIDLPNGGLAIVIGNMIEQGPNGQNSNIIGYGLEGLTNPVAHQLYLINNSVVNDRPSGSFVNIQTGTTLYKAYNNIFAGAGTTLSGTATTIDTMNNWRVTNISNAGFVNAATYDYHLTSTSQAINTGTNPGFANTYSLSPNFEYFHPANKIVRTASGIIDIGAHEFGISTSLNEVQNNPDLFSVLCDESQITLCFSDESSKKEIFIYSLNGKLISKKNSSEKYFSIRKENLSSGIYFVKVIVEEKTAVKKFLIAE